MQRLSCPWPIAALMPVLAIVASGCTTQVACDPPSGYTCTELAFPTGEKSTSTILVRQNTPHEIRVGQAADYIIDVTNLTGAGLQNVQVNLENLHNVQVLDSWPDAIKGTDGNVSWIIADLPARATKTITVRARPTAAGTASNCLTANYANVLCATTPVVAPSLDVRKSAPSEVCGQCGDIQLTYTVRNPGTGTADAVVVRDALPAGMTTADGRNSVEFRAGDLAPGAEKTFTASARADRTGTYASAATAQTGSGISARSDDVATVVRQPSFAFSCDANNRVFLGRDLEYRMTVKNIGGCDAADATVRATVPSGSTFVSANGGGKLENGNVVWNMANLPAGRASTVSMSIRPSGTGTAHVTATAAARCVPATTTDCQTEVAGIPAILLEVVDTVDPVEVGAETTFNVVVTNQGSSSDSNVRVLATLPDAMEYVSGSGATAVSASGQVVTIAPLATLAPGAKAEWRITVKAKAVADARSRWEMTSDQFKTPVIETESSNFYK